VDDDSYEAVDECNDHHDGEEEEEEN